MSKNHDGVVMYFGSYGSLDDARADFEGIKILKAEKFIGDYESALFEKNEKGDVKIIDTDATERAWGAKAGAITGAVIGLVFPPSLLAAGAVGAGAGALAGNLMRGIKRKDIKEIGDMLDEGQAGVILVGFTTIEEGVDRLMKRAAKVMKQEVDAQAEELKAQIDEAVK
jgi:uncharacterized membrane protein